MGFSLGKKSGMHTELDDYFKSWFSSGFKHYVFWHIIFSPFIDRVPFDECCEFGSTVGQQNHVGT